MPKFTGISLHTLAERLGPSHGKRLTGSGLRHHDFGQFWYCNGPRAPACYAYAHAADRAMPPDLGALEQEFFDHAPLPEEGWTLNPCPQHLELFADHPQEPD